MLLYLYNLNYDCFQIFENKTEKICNKTINWVINDICKQNLFEYAGYIKACKSILNLGYNIPVYLNNNLILFCLGNKKKFDNMWINYKAIKGLFKDEFNNTVILFQNNLKLKVETEYNKVLKIIKKCKIIEDYKNSKAIS